MREEGKGRDGWEGDEGRGREGRGKERSVRVLLAWWSWLARSEGCARCLNSFEFLYVGEYM